MQSLFLEKKLLLASFPLSSALVFLVLSITADVAASVAQPALPHEVGGLVRRQGTSSSELWDVEKCAPTDCVALNGTEFRSLTFRTRVETAYRYCDKFNAEQQQCHACAEAIFAQAVSTADGNTCVTKEHFRTSMRFCLQIVKEYNAPMSEELPVELDGAELPPQFVTEIPWEESGVAVVAAARTVSLAAADEGLANEAERSYRGSCSVKWATKPGYILYPPCANLVCALYGHPFFYRRELERCCAERSHHLGGDRWRMYCYYTSG